MNDATTGTEAKLAARRLRLLSYNIQAGLHTGHYGQYVTGVWRHALPWRGRVSNLARIADLMRGYDFVAVQEADAGSLRTLQQNQMEFLAERAGFPHYGLSVTRDLAPFARVCIGYLSRIAAIRSAAHTLPSRRTSFAGGRGALELELGLGERALTLIVTHLSLDRRARRRQLHYIAELVQGRPRVVLIGDLNCEAEFLRGHTPLQAAGLEPVREPPKTFPSWDPRRALDHVLVTPAVRVLAAEALPAPFSDHLPLAVEIAA